MKKIRLLMLLVLTAFVLFSVTALAADTAEPSLSSFVAIPGDVNEDGIVDANDALLLFQYISERDVEKKPDVDERALDVNGDGRINNGDAFYLYAYLGGAKQLALHYDYPCDHVIVIDPAVEATCQNTGLTAGSHCSLCQKVFEPQQVVLVKDHTPVALGEAKDATCSEAGLTAGSKCSVCGIVLEAQKVILAEHTWTNLADVDETGEVCSGEICSTCGEMKNVVYHNYDMDTPVEITAPTCTEAGYYVYACSNDGCEKTLSVEYAPAAHTRSDEVKRVEQIGTGADVCLYKQIFGCAKCDDPEVEFDGEAFYQHTYESETVLATCVKDGAITYTCTVEGCTETYSKVLTKDEVNGHNWVKNETESTGGKLVYECSHENCSAKKTVLDATAEDASVTGSALGEVGNVQLSEAEFSLNSAAANNVKALDAALTLVAAKYEKTDAEDERETLSLTPEQLELVGDNPVYDFTMELDGETVNFGENDGAIAVTLPYTLKDGEDPANVVIYYLADDGSVELIKATYFESNEMGYVVFTTDHFSHYVPAVLSAEEACELYGRHEYQTVTIAATCTEAGKTYEVCLNCSYVNEETVTVTEALGHEFELTESKDATCLVSGSELYTCTVCGTAYTKVLPVLEHSFKLDTEKCMESTCTTTGVEVYTCEHDCGSSYSKILPVKEHTYSTKITEATCTASGKIIYTCEDCGSTYTEDGEAAKGHTTSTLWYVDGENHYRICTVCEMHMNEGKHQSSGVLASDDEVHYYACSVCATHLDETKHTLVLTKTVEASCGKEGEKHYSCECGKTNIEYLEALEHTYGDWVIDKEPTFDTDGEKSRTCSICGERIDITAIPCTGSEGLVYASNGDGTCYVTGAGTFTGEKLVIPAVSPDGDAVVRVAPRAFQNNETITSVVVCEGVLEIYSEAFSGTKITSVSLPASLTTCSSDAFTYCTKLETIELAKGNETYEVEDGVLFTIGKTFLYCYPAMRAGEVYELPNTVTSMSVDAFHSTQNLKTLKIPASTGSISLLSFGYADSLEAIIVDEDNPKYYSVDGVLIETASNRFTKYPNGKTDESYSIPEGVTSFVNSTPPNFNNPYLKHVEIPESMSFMANNMLTGCENLESITVYNYNCQINENAVSGTITIYGYKGSTAETFANEHGHNFVSLTDEPVFEFEYLGDGECAVVGIGNVGIGEDGVLTIPATSPRGNKVTAIGESAFEYNTKIKSVVLPEGVTAIESRAFANCTILETIELPSTLRTIGDYVFQNTNIATISIPDGVVAVGQNIFYQTGEIETTTYNNGVYIGNETNPYHVLLSVSDTAVTEFAMHADTKVIANYALKNLNDVTELVFPEGLLGIGYDVMDGTLSVTEITIPASVEWIDEIAFLNANGLKAIHVDANNENYSSVDGVLMNKEQTILIRYPAMKEDTTYVMPETVTTMVLGAFSRVQLLQSVTISEAVKVIPTGAFNNCPALEEVNLPERLTTISEEAFLNCYSLKRMDIPSRVTSIGTCAFAYCTSLEEFTVDSGSRYLYAEDGVLFYKSFTLYRLLAYPAAKAATEYVIPNGVTQIYTNAFSGAQNLTKVTIPASVKTLYTDPFAGCDVLAEIAVAEDSTLFSSVDGVLYSFDGRELLVYPGGKTDTSFTVPVGVEVIATDAFHGIYLQEVSLPATVYEVNQNAFRACYNLRNLIVYNENCWFGSNVLPDERIETITGYTYSTAHVLVLNNKAVQFISIGEATPWKYTALQYRSNGDGTCIVTGPGTFSGSYLEIPTQNPDGETVVGIGSFAFSANTNLARVKIPDTVKSIGSGAFSSCFNLLKVDMPEYVDDFGNNVFNYCRKLTSAVIPEGVTSLGARTFRYCNSLTEMTLPSTLESFDISFLSSSTAIEKLTIKNPDMEIIDMFGKDVLPTICGYAGSTAQDFAEEFGYDFEVYEEVLVESQGLTFRSYSDGTCAVTGIGTFTGTKLVIPAVSPDGDEVIEIDSQAFVFQTQLQSVVIPEGVRFIYSNAFYGCENLKSVTLPSTLVSIYDGAFQGAAITTIEIPDSVRVIGRNVFDMCDNLEMIEYSNGYYLGNKENPYYALVQMIDTDKDSVDIHADTKVLASGIFRDMSNITEISLPDGLLAIGSYMIQDAPITEITIPASVQVIMEDAFAYAYSLQTIDVAENSECFASVDGVLFDKAQTRIYRYPAAKEGTSYVIPSTVYGIEQNAFAFASSLTSITIPETVTYIGYNAFLSCYALSDIEIPAAVTYIGSLAFSNCTSITEFKVADGNAYYSTKDGVLFNGTTLLAYPLGNEATEYVVPAGTERLATSSFEKSGYLTKVTISEGVTTIESNAFRNSLALTEVVMADTVVNIGSRVFQLCTALKDVTLSKGLTSIPTSMFYGCTSLENIALPEGIVRINNYAFYGCTSLTDVTIPSSLQNINYSAFYRCESLKNITIPSTVTMIAQQAFYGCSSLTTINIPASVRTIGMDAFAFCTSVTEFTVEEGNAYYSVNDGVLFSGTTLLAYPLGNEATEYVVPAGTTILAERAFAKAQNLTKVTIPDGVTTICGEAFWSAPVLTEVIMPDTVVTMGTHVFSLCEALENITLSKGLNVIPEGTFYGCISLTKVEIPEGVRGIDPYPFINCTNLAEVTLPSTLEWISWEAFRNCTALTKIEIPEGVVSIADCAFFDCTNLAEVTLPSTLEWIGWEVFRNCISLTEIAIPEGVVDIYPMAFYDCIGLTKVTLPSTLKWMGERAFYGCNSLTEITIPASLTEIYPATFQGCTSLTKVVLPEGLISIGDAAFFDCIKLAEVTLPSTLEKIGREAFRNCNALTAIVLPEGLTSIGNYAFQDCTSLTEIAIPEGVKAIMGSTFCGCTSLAKVTLPSTLRSIYNTAFRDCTSLTEIVIPEGVVSIAGSAFRGCTGLTEVTLPSTITSVMAAAFKECDNLAKITVLSDTCTLYNGCFPTQVTIYGHAGSAAEAYAANNGIAFVAISES